MYLLLFRRISNLSIGDIQIFVSVTHRKKNQFYFKVNVNLFLVDFPPIVIFRFASKYTPDSKLNLDMDPG